MSSSSSSLLLTNNMRSLIIATTAFALITSAVYTGDHCDCSQLASCQKGKALGCVLIGQSAMNQGAPNCVDKTTSCGSTCESAGYKWSYVKHNS
ncbi:hypothetical protein AC579_1623 [Pseudocercospora musae]|uniref:Uncharacterized protein n=1 Tax=Pseudocercospora musae TaxID=113226 RepID=A0A139H6D9_9PEZI|nr:hypothetical protein AC579_1623 [Pseudocercospora musae]